MSFNSKSSTRTPKSKDKHHNKSNIFADMNGNKKLSDYIILPNEKLGEGAFSKVYACTHKHTNKKYAMKVIKLSKLTTKELKLLSQEIWILHKLRKHDGIIRVEGIFRTKTHVMIVQEFCYGGDLYHYICSKLDSNTRKYDFDEEKAANIILQLAIGINYIHRKGITHRDIKPENILFKDKKQNKIKIIDFGLSGVENQMKIKCGTPNYVAPEILTQKTYGKKCDYWSLGCVLYLLLSGQFPFHGSNQQRLYDRIIHKDVDFKDPHWKNVSKEATWLITGLLRKNPSTRFGYKQIIQHPWIIKHCSHIIINLD